MLKRLVRFFPPKGKLVIIFLAELLKKRRWPKGIVFGYARERDMYYVSMNPSVGDGQRLYFYNPFRLGRYFHHGKTSAFDWMEVKYHLKEVSGEAPTCVEVGANIGEFSLAFKRLFPDGRLYSFEPDPVAFKCLCENLLHQDGCMLFEKAISKDVTDATFYLASDGADSSLIPPEKFESELRVNTWSLDYVLEAMKLCKIDLLKIEAEGYEPEILIGGQLMLQMTDLVVIDCGPERFGESTLDQCMTLLKDANFDCRVDGWRLIGSRRKGN